MAEPSILGRATLAKRTMAEPSKTHAPSGLRRLDDVHRHRLRRRALHTAPRRSQRGHLYFHHGLLERPGSWERVHAATLEVVAQIRRRSVELRARSGWEWAARSVRFSERDRPWRTGI